MRICAIVAILLLATSFSSAQTVPATAPADFYRDLFLGTYERGHHKDPRWDAAARRALEAQAMEWHAHDGQTEDEQDAIFAAGHEAIDAGCDDPVVQYVYARSLANAGFADHAFHDLIIGAARAMATENAPPLLRAYADARAAQSAVSVLFNRRAMTDAGKFFDDAIALMPTLATDATIPRRQIVDLFDVLQQAGRALNGSSNARWQRCYDAFAKSSTDQSLLLTLQAQWDYQLAWEIRGHGWAADVSPDEWKLFNDHMTSAGQSAEAAWNADHTNFAAAQQMVSIALGEGADRTCSTGGTPARWSPRIPMRWRWRA